MSKSLSISATPPALLSDAKLWTRPPPSCKRKLGPKKYSVGSLSKNCTLKGLSENDLISSCPSKDYDKPMFGGYLGDGLAFTFFFVFALIREEEDDD